MSTRPRHEAAQIPFGQDPDQIAVAELPAEVVLDLRLHMGRMRGCERVQVGRDRGAQPERNEGVVRSRLHDHAMVLWQNAAQVDRALGARRHLQAEVDEVPLGTGEVAAPEPQ